MRVPVNMNQPGSLRRRELAEPIGMLPYRTQDPEAAGSSAQQPACPAAPGRLSAGASSNRASGLPRASVRTRWRTSPASAGNWALNSPLAAADGGSRDEGLNQP